MIHGCEDLEVVFVEKAFDVYHLDGSEVVSRWYKGTGDVDCMFWFDQDSEIIRFQMNASGQVVDFTRHGESRSFELRTGLLIEEEIRLGNGAPVEVMEQIVFDSTLNFSLLNRVQRLIDSSSGLSVDKRQWVANRIQEGAEKHPRDCAVRGGKSLRQPFWRRIKRWALG